MPLHSRGFQKKIGSNLFSVFVHIPFTIMSKKSSGELARKKARSRAAAWLVRRSEFVMTEYLPADQHELKRITH
jgi:hypothetical protein